MNRCPYPQTFNARVAYMAKHLRALDWRQDERAFEWCGECGDGDLVVTALVRLAADDADLAEGMRAWYGFGGFCPSWLAAAKRLEHVRDLAAQSRRELTPEDPRQLTLSLA